jgi:hypothetical protein
VTHLSMRRVRLDTPILPEEEEGEDFDAYLNRVVQSWDPYGLFGPPAVGVPSASRTAPVRVKEGRWKRIMSLPHMKAF